MKYIESWHCPNCLPANPFSQSIIHHDGTVGECAGCGTKAVRHDCCQPRPFTKNVKWLPILMTGISLACPTCKTVYQISEQVQRSPDAPEWLKAGATFVGAVAFVVGLLKLGEMLDESFS
jgi:endogenous inhibitor of DNA gyrase (YacG/DUF329 family)